MKPTNRKIILTSNTPVKKALEMIPGKKAEKEMTRLDKNIMKQKNNGFKKNKIKTDSDQLTHTHTPYDYDKAGPNGISSINLKKVKFTMVVPVAKNFIQIFQMKSESNVCLVVA